MVSLLKRNISLWEAVFYGVGTIVGAGIYALIGVGAGIAGYSLWMSFLIGAVIAGLTALCYAELSSLFPKEAAEYVYLMEAFGSRFLSFLISWLIIITALFAVATVSLAFGNYLSPVLFNINPFLLAVFLVWAVTFLNLIGLKQSLRVNLVLTLISIFGLLFIVFLGLPQIFNIGAKYFDFNLPPLFAAASIMFFAFIGFEEIANIAEEVKEPKKNLPKAIIYSIFISSFLYVLISVVSVAVIPPQTLAKSEVPLADVAYSLLGSNAYFLISLIALAATSNTVLNSSVAASRLFYGLGENRVLPKIFSKVSLKTHTPIFSILLVGLLQFFLLFLGNLKFLAEMTNAGIFLVFIAVNLSLIKIRLDFPMKKIYSLPEIRGIPVYAILAIIANLVLFFSLPFRTILLTILLSLVSYPLYLLFNHLTKKSFLYQF